MFASVLDDGQIHNSFQKLLEKYEEMADMSFESNQYNIYSPDRSTQNSPNKDLSPPRQVNRLVESQENNDFHTDGMFFEDFEIEQELNSEEKKAKAKEVKSYLDLEDFRIEGGDFELISSSPKEPSMDDIMPLIRPQQTQKMTSASTLEKDEQLNLKKKLNLFDRGISYHKNRFRRSREESFLS